MPKCFPKWLSLFMFPQQLNRVPVASHSLQYLILFDFSSFQHSEYDVLSHCDFCFPDYRWGWMSFYMFMSHLCFPLLNEYCLSTSHLLGAVWVSSTSLKYPYLSTGHFSIELFSFFKGVLYQQTSVVEATEELCPWLPSGVFQRPHCSLCPSSCCLNRWGSLFCLLANWELGQPILCGHGSDT